jgi:hypothetical protein
MSVNLTRRVAALEASLAPDGKVIPIWGMRPDGEPMTDREIEDEISALRKAGAPSNAEFVPILWQIV